ncbi:SRPBCC domain-containing protein [Thalassiella azotivora]
MTPSDPRMGEVLTDGERTVLRFERRLAHPPEKVWRALTESEHLRYWFPADVVGERCPGAALTFPFWPDVVERHGIEDAVLPGELRVWDPPRTLELTWDTDLLRWELEPVGGATHLVLTTWVGAVSGPSVESNLAGYHVCLDTLEQLLDTGTATPVAQADPSALEERYRALVSAG